MQSVQMLTVTEDEDGQRVDNFLLARLRGVPKSAVYRVIRKGQVRVNKGRVKPERRLVAGDLVRVPPLKIDQGPVPAMPGAGLRSLLAKAIVYDRDGLVIIDKPSGLAVHGGSGINLGMIEALRQMPGFSGFLELVHRLDRETSGCVMVARKRSVLKYYQDLLRQRDGVTKRYVALVQGRWPKHCQLIDVPLERYQTHEGERRVRAAGEGKPSQTHFSVIERFHSVTLVEAKPLTGRTHQIRVHAAHVGCPLVGDDKYGDTSLNGQLHKQGFNRLFLHAASLELRQPDGTIIKVDAPLPEDLQKAVMALPGRSGGA